MTREARLLDLEPIKSRLSDPSFALRVADDRATLTKWDENALSDLVTEVERLRVLVREASAPPAAEVIASFVEHLRDGYASTTEPVTKVARLIRERFGELAQSATGTFACPVCGGEEPHGHDDLDIFTWLDAQASRFGYRMHDKQWILRPVDGQGNRVEHAIRRLTAKDVNAGGMQFASTPIGRYTVAILREELPFIRTREAEALELARGELAPSLPPEGWQRFNEEAGCLYGGNEHPDRCVCQEQEAGQFAGTPHKHYAEAPHACARCTCPAYRPVAAPSSSSVPQKK